MLWAKVCSPLPSDPGSPICFPALGEIPLGIPGLGKGCSEKVLAQDTQPLRLVTIVAKSPPLTFSDMGQLYSRQPEVSLSA